MAAIKISSKVEESVWEDLKATAEEVTAASPGC